MQKAAQIGIYCVSNRPLKLLTSVWKELHAATEYKVDVIGGDTTSSQKDWLYYYWLEQTKRKLFIEVAKRWSISSSAILERRIWDTSLEREKQVFQVNPNSQPDLDAYTYLIERN
jgi:thiamine-monophosphate kinase